jgi:hypothetical protein
MSGTVFSKHILYIYSIECKQKYSQKLVNENHLQNEKKKITERGARKRKICNWFWYCKIV